MTKIQGFFKEMKIFLRLVIAFSFFLLVLFPFAETANAVVRTTPRQEYPQGYFGQPLDIPMRLAGNFGELRTNHFHTGLDCKTDGQENLNLYALADGHVSRVVVSARGYGNAVYIDYPNGFTSVFAHINTFAGQIGEYVKRKQYELQRFEIDEPVSAGLLPVYRGQVVAKSGNTGSSNGPHLHFEIRDTYSEEAINPLLFGYSVPDDIKPGIKQLALYRFKGQTQEYDEPSVYSTQLHNGVYATTQNLLKLNTTRVGLGIKTFDQQNGLANLNGVFSIKMFDNGNPLFAFEMERINFSENRYINAHIDYQLKKEGDGLIQKCFVEPGNRLSIYKNTLQNGIIDLSDGLLHKITMEVRDVRNNTSTLSIMLQYDSQLPLPPPALSSYNAQFTYFTDNSYNNDYFQLFLPAGSLYNNLFFNYDMKTTTLPNVYSHIHKVHQGTTPVHQFFDIAIKPLNLPFNLYDYAVIAYKNAEGKEIALSSRWEGAFLKAKSREFGNYYITIDSKPPTIKSINLLPGKAMSKYKTIEVQISDNLAGIETYNGYIDDRWVLMEYDQKKARLWHTFDDVSGLPGPHEFRLVVTDGRGNAAEYKAKFTR
ncbi:M23 family peptidase [Sphingobacteriales bacterium UPWRP_1]|nr:hypothetical protein B6N25_04845 [Sphingobacteriales bacterium TSM_CSS]PSJ78288.1 M23 family peptidase [Sphingobacteriales bacterium UPWRP_1]